jgi:hypothetical protein
VNPWKQFFDLQEGKKILMLTKVNDPEIAGLLFNIYMSKHIE